jgi:large subunit ribosomal protein L25
MALKKTTLAAQTRAKAGKGAARATRRTGSIPGVIYGDHKEPVLISLPVKDLTMAIAKKGFFTQLCDLTVEGANHLVLPRDVQLNPVTDRPEHVDFLRVTEKTVIRVHVPVRVVNQKDSPGLTKGGVLNVVRHEVDVYCPATEIPEEFIVDLKGVDVGRSIHIGDINLPKNVRPVVHGNFTVITIVAPSAMKSEAEEAAAAATAATVPAAAEGAAAAPAAGAAPAAAAPAKGAAPAAAPAKDAGKGGAKK